MSREIVNLRGKRSNGSLGNGQTVLEIGKRHDEWLWCSNLQFLAINFYFF
jgi:hypothetical protein